MDIKIKDDQKGEQSESGFYCEVCDCIVKDSLNYLDHINGKRHNRNLGISLKKFTDCSLEEVKKMLELKKRERDERLSGFSVVDTSKEDEERWRQIKRDKKRRQRARRSGNYVEDDYDDEEEDDGDDDADEDENDDDNGGGGGGGESKNEKEEQQDEEEDEMAKLMGFSSFSTTKK